MQLGSLPTRRPGGGVALWLGLALAGCAGGEIGLPLGGGPGDGDPQQAPVPSPETFDCAPDAVPEPAPLRRLTRYELENALEDVFGELAPSSAGWLPGAVRGAVDQVPQDLATEALDYRRMSQEVSQGHVDGVHHLARSVADALAASPDRLREVVGPCAGNDRLDDDDACLEAWIRDFGERVFRRPLSEAEVALYTDTIDPSATSAADRVRVATTAMLMAPPFYYQLELGGEPVPGTPDTFELTPHELASRLALTFWRSVPDAELLEAARSGALDDPDGYRAEVERLLADPRAERAVDRFFEDWLTLHRVPALDGAVDRPDFRAYAGDDLPDARLRQAVVDELLSFTRHVFASDGTVEDLFLSRASFVESPDVADLYGGVPLWSEGEPPVQLPAAERAGLLTRIAVLANDQATTRPILRGARILTRVLCDEVELPENMEEIELPRNDGARSTREKVAALTEREGSVCVNCHQAINPLGFAFEGYDALGRVRTDERVFAPDGSLLATFPVDTEAEALVTSRGPAVTVADGVELSAAVAESPKVRACFARQLTRHLLGRRESLQLDGCTLEPVRAALEGGGSIREAMVALATSPAFLQVRK